MTAIRCMCTKTASECEVPYDLRATNEENSLRNHTDLCASLMKQKLVETDCGFLIFQSRNQHVLDAKVRQCPLAAHTVQELCGCFVCDLLHGAGAATHCPRKQKSRRQ